uniref:Aminopeptidase n=1 Tax=Cyclopterus lumpus TaxID=8103 RepID=A0A8C2XDC4_CYCLU
MGKGFYIGKAVGIVGIILCAGALATIIALSVVYSQEKTKSNNQVSPTAGGTTANPPVTPSPSNEPWDKYRLPKTLVPDHYNVTLWPRLTLNTTTGLYIFTGNGFLLISDHLELDHFLNPNELHSGVTQYLVLQLNGKLVKDHRYHLDTEFTGELADDLGGFYRSEYQEDGITKYVVVATTQMQPTDARKAFPCFDEPAMKAIFYITLIHNHGTVALSNGEVKVLSTTHNCPVRVHSSLILNRQMVYQNFLEIRIFAKKSAIAAGQGEYALNKTGPILKFFERYYNSRYPLPKSDQIALPDFNAGAMENWGLITYRETALLYDEKFSSNSNKQRIATIIAHELAHMWFGNLVTVKWWNDLWLNEGFASYVEYLGAHEAEPDWNVKDLIVLSDVHRVFAVDALASSHPLSSREEDIQKPAQISELFDAISYSKVTSYTQTLTAALSIMKISNINRFRLFYTDLWDHLQMAYTVKNIMNTWVLQMGFPVVTINTTTGVVSQEHFLLDPDSEVTAVSPFNYEWIVPIKWMKTGFIQEPQWLRSKSATIIEMKAPLTDWVLANLDVVGYYRVNYDQGNWNRLVDHLKNNHKLIPVINRAQLVDDAFNLARAKIIPTELALDTTKYLNQERDYMPWESALSNLDFFYLMFDRSEVYGPMQNYLRNQVTPLFDYYKNMTDDWSKVPDGHMDQYNQVNAISMACRTDLEECLLFLNCIFGTIHPNLRSTVYCNAIAAGGAQEWEFAWTEFQNTTIAIEADKLRFSLACTKQPWLLNRYLEYTLIPGMIRKQDATSTIVYIANNVVGQSLAWDFVRARWSYIFTEYGGGSFSFSNLINGVTQRFSTEFELQQLEKFKAENSEIGFGSGTLAVDQSIERTISNIKWLTENKENVLNWFNTAL